MAVSKSFASAIAAACLAMTPAVASAQTQDGFYKGKQLTIIVGDTAGSSYTSYAQLVQRHLPKQLAGEPQMIIRMMPGAGGVIAANYLAAVAPKDGTAIGGLYRGTGTEPLFKGGESKLKFDPRDLNWLYSLNSEVSMAVAWHTTGIKRFEDLYDKELLVAIGGVAGDAAVFGFALNGIMGTKLKMICCYQGSAGQDLAMERGEIGGRLNFSWAYLKASKPDWLKDGTIKLLAQLALAKHSDLPNVPLVLDLVKDPEDKKIMEIVLSRQNMGRPFAAPPGLPADRVAMLRDAFDRMVHDAEFLADADKSKIEINDPMPGAEINALIDRMYKVSPATLERMRATQDPNNRKDVVKKEGAKESD
ncbi:MAG: Bug family tripartite tricarboxylate transporter substrate binding protein [Gemmatimonas sp.]